MPFVLDASIAACWAFDDEDHPVAALALERVRTDEARVPSLWWFEVRNTLIVNERRGRLLLDPGAFLDHERAIRDGEAGLDALVRAGQQECVQLDCGVLIRKRRPIRPSFRTRIVSQGLIGCVGDACQTDVLIRQRSRICS
jgi:hypothetical protein